ncbi:MAG: preprotein translocase subunit YajC [Bryocella sp.]
MSILAFALALPMGGFGGLPLLIIMFVVMYMLLILPNQRKQKTWQTMLSKLKTGDKITTTGGLRGTIVSIKDDAVVVKTSPDNIKLEIVRSAISAVTTDEVKP